MVQSVKEVRTKRERQLDYTIQQEDREMNECLARLNVWQTENLMAPHGMDRFAVRPEENR